ncbi:hypothetical protein [Lentzea kentuckyensis]|uniref:hypothetical protein n=1 Tax=Lentzea kentuckyensis TaxID=360086 RepID=UPI001179B9F1|nr:hypothetical protein [Lentzea kentuckyensis]
MSNDSVSNDGGPPPPRPSGGNLWDADANTEGLRYLMRVQRMFDNFVAEHVRFVQEDPYAGRNANREAEIGRELVFLGEQMQEHARLRATVMEDYGVSILQHLATLKKGERADVYAIADAIGTFAAGVDIAAQDLARSGAVDVVRPRTADSEVTTYAITPQGRALLQRPAIVSAPASRAIGGSDADGN